MTKLLHLLITWHHQSSPVLVTGGEYVAEDGVTQYVAEDGLTQYIMEA